MAAARVADAVEDPFRRARPDYSQNTASHAIESGLAETADKLAIPRYSPRAMGFYYRKSVNIGPFRANVSKSGVGASVGGRGFRTGVTARGRRYTTFSIPGTGIGYRASGKGAGCLLIGLIILGTVAISIGATLW